MVHNKQVNTVVLVITIICFAVMFILVDISWQPQYEWG